MNSKALVRLFLQPVLDAGMTQKAASLALGVRSTNYVSQLLSDEYPTELLSPDRIPAFAHLCELTEEETLQLTFARLRDAGDGKVKFSFDTLAFVLKTTQRAVRARVARKALATTTAPVAV